MQINMRVFKKKNKFLFISTKIKKYAKKGVYYTLSKKQNYLPIYFLALFAREAI